MVRAPCCEKMGLKKGPWTPEEDNILVNYIQLYGHENWRALPKQAGLLRCGKSCRLRWTNYLRPDIKRGNFTSEEEDTIIQLHEMLGNRWSAIAARLPGRTDNEIKNVWHTHLKKRLKQSHSAPQVNQRSTYTSKFKQESKTESEFLNLSSNPPESEAMDPYGASSPQGCSSDICSSVSTGDTTIDNNTFMKVELMEDFPEMDDSFWSEMLYTDNLSVVGADPQVQHFPFSPLVNAMVPQQVDHVNNSRAQDTMEFWHKIFTGAGELPEPSEIL
ncbi:hypothetical protein K2173_026303 [Erythroxylum novogranatense]|uniref:Uncharacterized protein n=1 Tax=Erythroxylum novogranatense TaxID=1862640 RepID=A0AAV8SC86_9ROSI|nr:hypothetical protein K2173_026303 [Erythroxylum novogranatense]